MNVLPMHSVAPGAGGHAISSAGAMSRPWPSLEERLVEPGTPYEMLDGELIVAPPCDEAHGQCHMDVGYVLRTYVAPGYKAVIDVLTRVDEHSDIAPDVSIIKEGIDPETGTRYLEELAIEIKYTQRPGQLARRATLLARRGVKRVFALWVKRQDDKIIAGPVYEWQPEQNAWQKLPEDGVIEAPCLRYPLPVRALLDAAALDEAVAKAVMQSQHPVIQRYGDARYQQGESDGYVKGESDGGKKALRQMIADMCSVFAIELSDAREAAMQDMNAEELMALHHYLVLHRSWPDA